MTSFTSFNFYHNSGSSTLDVILHGGSSGIESPFIQKLFNTSRELGNSVVAFNFPYIERGKENSSGEELKEELNILERILDLCEYKKYNKIRLLGKSLGGIVASFYLDKLPLEESKRFSVVILGYITGGLKLKNFKGKISIIQGQKDKFGGIDVVKNDLKNAMSGELQFFEIEGADHSYRVPETKEPIYEDKAIELLRNID